MPAATATRTRPDAVGVAAVDAARDAALEVAPPGSVGEHLGVEPLGRAAGRPRLRLHGQGLPRLALDGRRRRAPRAPRSPRSARSTCCPAPRRCSRRSGCRGRTGCAPATSAPATCCRRSSRTTAPGGRLRGHRRRGRRPGRALGARPRPAAGAVADRPRGGRGALVRGRVRPHVRRPPRRRGAVPQLRLPAAACPACCARSSASAPTSGRPPTAASSASITAAAPTPRPTSTCPPSPAHPRPRRAGPRHRQPRRRTGHDELETRRRAPVPKAADGRPTRSARLSCASGCWRLGRGAGAAARGRQQPRRTSRSAATASAVLVELAQNAADAAVRAGVPGRLLLRLVDGDEPALVAANTGAPLDAEGVLALSTLRASAKRDGGDHRPVRRRVQRGARAHRRPGRPLARRRRAVLALADPGRGARARPHRTPVWRRSCGAATATCRRCGCRSPRRARPRRATTPWCCCRCATAARSTSPGGCSLALDDALLARAAGAARGRGGASARGAATAR